MSDYEKMTGDKKISEIEDLVEIDGGEKVLVAFNGQNYVISVDRLINEGHLHSYQDLEDLQALLNIVDAQYQHRKDSTLPTTSKEISGAITEIYNLISQLNDEELESLKNQLQDLTNQVEDNSSQLAHIENYVTLKTFGYSGDSETDSTIFFEKAFAYLQSLGGGILNLDSGVYKCNIEIPSGILIRGNSRGGMTGAGVQGTILKSYNHTLPIIRIGGNVTAIGVENITIEGRVGGTPTSEIGLLIDGATEIKFDNILLKYCKTNCIVRNNGTIPTFFIYFNNSSSIKASSYNMKIEQDGNASGFVTAIYFNNFASNNYFVDKSSAKEGSVFYTQAEIFTSNTWLEANSDNFIVVDKSTNPFARIKASNTVIDGGSINSVVKCYGASTIGIPDFIQGSISVDGKLSLNDTDKIVDIASRGEHLYRPMTSNAELGGVTYFVDVNQADISPKQLPHMYVSNGGLIFNAVGAKSTGIGALCSYTSPFSILASDGASRLWYKDNMLYCKSFGGKPTSSTDGNIIMSYQVNPPASKTSSGKTGYVSADDTYVYICVSDSNWIRIKKDLEW